MKTYRKQAEPTFTNEVEKVAMSLCEAQNRVTTLEIKVALRTKFPQYSWEQADISNVMQNLYLEGKFTYTDTGSFRIYEAVATRIKTKPKGSKKLSNALSKTDAYNMIVNSKGKFMVVTFITKKGSERVLLCQYSKDTKQTPLGYVTVKDVNAMRNKNIRPYKNVNLQTLKEIKTGGVTHKVR